MVALLSATLTHHIKCVPEVYQSRLTPRRVIRLVGYASSQIVLYALVGSLKRAAIKAIQQIKRLHTASRIHFGAYIPFKQILALVRRGFETHKQSFRQRDRRILEHYQVARNCLESYLEELAYNLLLMLVLTIASSFATPTMLPSKHKFEVGVSKNASSFIANLATRILWFLRSDHFITASNNSTVLSITEITKKMEYKDINNQFLQELGQIRVIYRKYNTPRNSDLTLLPIEELLQ